MRKNAATAEKLLWERIKNRKFLGKKFLRQHPIFFDLLGKETFYIADFYCHENKFVVESDGKYHEYQKQKDKLRTEILNELGITLIRFKNEEVENNIYDVLADPEEIFIQK